jgi:hypothetical protein
VSDRAATEYEIDGRVSVRATAEALVQWLVAPARMCRWMLGVDAVEALEPQTPGVGARVRVTASIGVSGGMAAGWTFVGEIVELAPERLVRRYRIEDMRAGALPVGAGDEQYERTVTYELDAYEAGVTSLACSATTVIPGLHRSAARAGAKAERRALGRSLERLRADVEGSRPGLLARFGDSGKFAGPL